MQAKRVARIPDPAIFDVEGVCGGDGLHWIPDEIRKSEEHYLVCMVGQSWELVLFWWNRGRNGSVEVMRLLQDGEVRICACDSVIDN